MDHFRAVTRSAVWVAVSLALLALLALVVGVAVASRARTAANSALCDTTAGSSSEAR